MRAIIFANGEFEPTPEVRALLDASDVVIAADGGTRHALALGQVPDVIIGDLDSLAAQTCERAQAAGSRFVSFSPRKDETDLELALRLAAEEGATEIVILAALGGRLDQTIANLLLLALPELSDIDVRIVAGRQMALLVRGGRDGACVEGQPGDTLSLIPLGGDAVGVTADGLEWPLDAETLAFGPARGVSNVLTAGRARVRVREGLLLCVLTRE